MRNKTICAVLVISFWAFGQFCEQIPGSLTEAEYLLENGGIDSTCFLRFRELLLNPVNPRREGWRRIRELSSEQDGAHFPSISELSELPDSSAKEMILKIYPWLQPFEPLFFFEPQHKKRFADGLVSANITGKYNSDQTTSRLRTVCQGANNRLSGELSAEVKGQNALFTGREISVTYPKIEGSIGNIQVLKRSLLWGYFSSAIDETDPLETFLYGSRSTWNGGVGIIQNSQVKIETIIHQRGDEEIQHGEVKLKKLKINPQVSVTRQVRDRENTLVAIGFSDSSQRFFGESVFSQNGGVACTFGGTVFSEKVRGEIEIWALSEQFASEFSSRYKTLLQRYSSQKSSVGIQSNWSWTGILIRYESRFSGEICDGGGRSDFAMAVRWPLVWNSSIHQRFVSYERDSSKEQFVESAIRAVPKLNRFTFPMGSENRFNSQGWNKTVFSLGGKFTGAQICPDLSLKYKIHKDKTAEFEARIAAVHRMKSGSTSSLSVVIPFTDPKSGTVAGNVTIMF